MSLGSSLNSHKYRPGVSSSNLMKIIIKPILIICHYRTKERRVTLCLTKYEVISHQWEHDLSTLTFSHHDSSSLTSYRMTHQPWPFHDLSTSISPTLTHQPQLLLPWPVTIKFFYHNPCTLTSPPWFSNPQLPLPWTMPFSTKIISAFSLEKFLINTEIILY